MMHESSQAREAYDRYLSLGPQRSTAKVAQALGKSKTLIDRWCGAHAWVERIAAHERRLAAEREAEDAGKRRKMAEARIAIAIAEMDLGSRGLRAKRPEDLSARDIVALLQHSFDAQRKDLGEPDQRVEVAGPDGRDITVRVIYDDGTGPHSTATERAER